MLAFRYGWSKREILEEVYPEEIPGYRSKIDKREALDRMQEIEIAGTVFGSKEYRQKIYGEYIKQFQGAEPYIPKTEEFDETGFNRLKNLLFR